MQICLEINGKSGKREFFNIIDRFFIKTNKGVRNKENGQLKEHYVTHIKSLLRKPLQLYYLCNHLDEIY